MAGDYRGNYIRSFDDTSSLEEDTTIPMYSAGKEWTDEKHSLYLKSMEASFVDQLYSSLGSKDNKMNVRQPHEYRLKGRHGGGSHHEFLRSPWIKHYMSLPKTPTPVRNEGSYRLENNVVSSKGLVICSSGSASNLKNMVREGCSRDRDQISTREEEEVSDQNFVNEVTKGQNGRSKKMKTVMSESSNTDQVVPLKKSHANMT